MNMKSKLGLALCLALAVAFAAGCASAPADIQDANEAALTGEQGDPSRANDFGATYGPIATFDLRPGDCFDDDGQTVEFLQVLRVPCDGYFTHRVLDLILVEEGPWPGQEFLEGEAAAQCDISTEAVIIPSPDTWFLGDRTIFCLEINP
jgi:hypothetical protein